MNPIDPNAHLASINGNASKATTVQAAAAQTHEVITNVDTLSVKEPSAELHVEPFAIGGVQLEEYPTGEEPTAETEEEKLS